MEDAWNMAESMLSDVLVSNAYNQFITQNSILFKDKVSFASLCRLPFYSMIPPPTDCDGRGLP